MTLDEAIKRYTSNAFYEKSDGNLQGYLEFNQLAEWLKNYKRLLEQEPCEDAQTSLTTKNALAVDCVSRKEVEKLVYRFLGKNTDENIAFYEHFLDLPSVTLQEHIFNKIRIEIIQLIQNGVLKIESGNEALFDIIDKYRAGSEESKNEN